MNTDFERAMQAGLRASQVGDGDSVVAHLQHAATVDPASPAPYFVLAAHFAEVRQNDLAEAAYLECLQRAPDMAIARFQLGLLQLTTGRPAVAQVNWAPLIRQEGVSSLKLFAQGLVALLAGEAGAARGLIREGMRLNPDNAPLNADMQGVLDRLDLAAPAPASQGGADAHFLIGAYRQGG